MENNKNETKRQPTPGPWEITNYTYVNSKSTKHGFICNTSKGYMGMPGSEQFANAELIAEAGTVYHETGLTPRELLEQRDELTKSLIECLDGVLELNGEFQESWDDVIKKAQSIIAKTTNL